MSLQETSNPCGSLSRYEVAHLVDHLSQSGQAGEIHRLLALEFRIGKSSSRNAWLEVRQSETSLQDYLSDVHLAWQLVRSTHGDISTALHLQFRYALIVGSVSNTVSSLPPQLVAKLVDDGFWTIDTALSFAGQSAGKGAILCVLAKRIPERLIQAYLDIAAQLSSFFGGRTEALIAVTPKLTPALAAKLLELFPDPESVASGQWFDDHGEWSDEDEDPSDLLRERERILPRLIHLLAIPFRNTLLKQANGVLYVDLTVALARHGAVPDAEHWINCALKTAFDLPSNERPTQVLRIASLMRGRQQELLVRQALIDIMVLVDSGDTDIFDPLIDYLHDLDENDLDSLFARHWADLKPLVINYKRGNRTRGETFSWFARTVIAHLGADDIAAILDAVNNSQDERTKQSVLAAVCPIMTPELLPRALTVLNTMEPRSQARALAAETLSDYLPPESVVTELKPGNLYPQTGLLRRLAEINPVMALDVAKHLSSPKAWAVLADRIPIHLLQTHANAARSLSSRDDIAIIVAFASRLPGDDTEGLLTSALNAAYIHLAGADAGDRVHGWGLELIRTLGRDTPPSVVAAALKACRSIEPWRYRQAAIAHVGMLLLSVEAAEVLSAFSLINDTGEQISLHIAVASFLTRINCEKQARDVISAALLPAKGESSVSEREPNSIYEGLCTLTGEQSSIAVLTRLSQLAEFMPPALIYELLRGIASVEDGRQQSQLWQAVGREIPPELFPLAFNSVKELAEAEAREISLMAIAESVPELEAPSFLASLGIRLPGSGGRSLASRLIADLERVADRHNIDDSDINLNKAVQRLALSHLIKGQQFRTAVKVIEALSYDPGVGYSAEALALISAALPPVLVLQLWNRLKKLDEDEPDYKLFMLAALVPGLPSHLLGDAVELILATGAGDDLADALARISPYLPLHLLDHIIGEVSEKLPLGATYAAQAERLAAIGDLTGAAEAARKSESFAYDGYYAQALISISLRSSGLHRLDLLKSALMSSNTIDDGRSDILRQLSLLLQQVSPEDALDVLGAALTRWTTVGRTDLLLDIAPFLSLLTRLGGADTIVHLSGVVYQVCNWWP